MAELSVAQYRQQNVLGWLIFLLVSLMCLSGIILAAIQLYWSKEQLKDISNGAELSARGIKVASPFVGLMLLVVSFAFFYMYIKDVYTIAYQTPMATIAAPPGKDITAHPAQPVPRY